MPMKEFQALVFILQYNQSYGWSCAVLCILTFMEVIKGGLILKHINVFFTLHDHMLGLLPY